MHHSHKTADGRANEVEKRLELYERGFVPERHVERAVLAMEHWHAEQRPDTRVG